MSAAAPSNVERERPTRSIGEPPAPAPNRRMARWLSLARWWALTLAGFLLAAELTCRIDDWLRFEVPLMHAPERMQDLQVLEGGLVHGRPFGRYEKWKLNRYGFRSGEISRLPADGVTRVMVLGASESYGLYESEGQEFPAQLEVELRQLGEYEVVNAAIPGMTVATMVTYWERWARQFQPDIVVVYPSPFSYLNFILPPKMLSPTELDDLPPLDPDGAIAVGSPRLSSRLGLRLRQAIDLPDAVQAWRDARTVNQLTTGQPADWVLHAAPPQNLDWLMNDLEQLVAAIERRGAAAIVLTHPIRCEALPTPQDVRDIERLRVHNPRMTPAAFVEFEVATRQRLLDDGRLKGWRVIDIAGPMNGKSRYFADPVHLTDAGAQVVAEMVAEHIRNSVARRPTAAVR